MNAACTNLNARGHAPSHSRRALKRGRTPPTQILMVLKMASLLAIHSCSHGAPMLLEEAKAAGVRPASEVERGPPPRPAISCERSVNGTPAWDPFFDLDPEWTEQFIAVAFWVVHKWSVVAEGRRTADHRLRCLLQRNVRSGHRRYIKAALELSAMMEEIMEVLKLCVVQGVQACNLGVPILAEELQRVD